MKTSFLSKIFYLLPNEFKKRILFLIILLIFGVFFEMLGLGFLFPVMKVLLSENIAIEYPSLKLFLNYIGNPSRNNLIYLTLFLLILIYFVKSVFLFFLSWKQAKINSEISSFLSKKLFFGYLTVPYSFHLNRNSAKLLTNIQNEIGSFYNAGQALITITIEGTLLLSVLLLMFFTEPIGSLLLISFFAISSFIFQSLTKSKITQWGKIRVKNVSEMNKYLVESFSGIKEIILLGVNKFFINKINNNLNKTSDVTIKQVTLQQAPRYYLELTSIIGLSILIASMLKQGKTFNEIIPTIGIFFAGIFRLIPSLNRIMGSFQSIQFLKPSINLIYNEFHFLDSIPEINNSDKEIKFSNRIVIRDLFFQYESNSRKILKSINLEIKKGQTIGFIGPSGSGKSTLVDLILGLFNPSGGNIFIDDKKLTKEDVVSWQRLIGYVPQSIFLTDDTIKRNIAFGIPDEEINLNKINQSISYAQLDDFIYESKLGIETQIGERGVKLSGGQRQRIGIARALYNNPQILILDEATSALDNKTESDFMKAIDLMKGTKTIIIVAHRLTTLKNCDKIFSINNGVLKEESKSILN